MNITRTAGRRRPTVARGLAVAAASLALVLSACSTGGSDGADSDTLNVGIGSEPETLDPDASRAGTDKYFTRNVYERLFERDAAGDLVPALATEYSVSEDGLTVTYKLREGVTFHNGEAMTADDVAFSFERFKREDLGNIYAYTINALESTNIIDDYTIEMKLSRPDPGFITGGPGPEIVPKDYIEENGDEYFGQNPVGTGALKFVERKVNDSFTLERFDDYWGEKAGYQTVVVKILPDANSRISALRSGQVDLISQVPYQDVPTLSNENGLKLERGFSGENFFIKLGLTDPSAPWSDQRVREALDLAIDKQAIIDNVLNGYGQVYPGITEAAAGYDKVDFERSYDPDAARDLLAEAGFSDGFEITLDGPVNGAFASSEQVMQAVAGYWEEIGVTVKVNILEYSQWIDSIAAKNTAMQAAIGLHGDNLTYDPVFRMNAQLACGASYSHVCDDELTQKIEVITQATTGDAYEDAYVDAFRRIFEGVLDIPVFTVEQAYAMDDSICWKPTTGAPYPRLADAAVC